MNAITENFKKRLTAHRFKSLFFANNSVMYVRQPTLIKPIAGQVWVDTESGIVQIHTESSWMTVGCNT
jgi:hypothetical protein